MAIEVVETANEVVDRCARFLTTGQIDDVLEVLARVAEYVTELGDPLGVALAIVVVDLYLVADIDRLPRTPVCIAVISVHIVLKGDVLGVP